MAKKAPTRSAAGGGGAAAGAAGAADATVKMSRGTKLPAREMATSMRRAKPLKQTIPQAMMSFRPTKRK